MRLIFALRCFSYEYSSGQHTILRFTPFLRFDSCVIILRCDVKIQSGAKDYYSLIRDSCFTLGRENPGETSLSLPGSLSFCSHYIADLAGPVGLSKQCELMSCRRTRWSKTSYSSSVHCLDLPGRTSRRLYYPWIPLPLSIRQSKISPGGTPPEQPSTQKHIHITILHLLSREVLI